MGYKSFIDYLIKFIPFLEPYPVWVKLIFCVWLFLIPVIITCLLFTKPSPKEPVVVREPDSVSEKKQVFVPAIDIEFLTTMNDEHNFVTGHL